MASNSSSMNSVADIQIEIREPVPARNEGNSMQPVPGTSYTTELVATGRPDNPMTSMHTESPGIGGDKVITLVPRDSDESVSGNTEPRQSPPVEKDPTKPQNKGTGAVPSAPKMDSMDNGIEIEKLLVDILETLQDSSIAGPTAAKDVRSRFWAKYKRVAEEHDIDFLERYNSDMDIVLIFAGLFSAVSTSFIAMEPSLLPDPTDTTNALLLQIAQMLGNSSLPGQAPPVTVPVFPGPSQMDVWVQTITYLSLSSSLLAAFGAVLGKQWLGYYKATRYGRGSLEEWGVHHQEKFEGLQTWYFDAIVQSFPLLIQFSLVLFGLALSGHMWSEQQIIAGVIIASTSFGVLFYLFTLFASLISPACPFQSPLSTIIHMLPSTIIKVYWYINYHIPYPLHSMYITIYIFAHYKLYFPGVRLLGVSHLQNFIQHLSHFFHPKNQSTGSIPTTDLTAILATPGNPIDLNLSQKSLKSMGASPVLWLLETSTDPEVLLAALQIVPQVEWQPDLDTSTIYLQLSQIFLQSFNKDHSLISGEESKAMIYGRALTYLISQMDGKWYIAMDNELTDNGNQIGHCIHFWSNIRKSMNHLGDMHNYFFKVVASESSIMEKISFNNSEVDRFLNSSPDSDVLHLLHLFPYTQVDFLQSSQHRLAIGAISKILTDLEKRNLSPESPGVSDCAMVLAMVLGFKFKSKDKWQLDKSMAFKKLVAVIYIKITSILQHCSPSQQKAKVLEDPSPKLQIEGPSAKFQSEDPSKLEQNTVTYYVPLLSSLLKIVSSFHPYILWPMDESLHICQLYFDKSFEEVNAKLQVCNNPTYLPYFHTSMKAAITSISNNQINEDEVAYADWKDPLWDLERNSAHTKQANLNLDHPWLLKYLRYLCDTFSGDRIDIQRTLLVSVYALGNLQHAPEMTSFLETITFCLRADRPFELRCAALRAIHARQDIFSSIAEVEKLLEPFQKFSEVLHDDFGPPLGSKEDIVVQLYWKEPILPCRSKLRKLTSNWIQQANEEAIKTQEEAPQALASEQGPAGG